MGSDQLEFQKIHEEFRPKIHRYLTHLVGEYEAEDLTQEIFIKIDRALKTFREEARLSTWIYRIATNAAIDKMRASSFQQEGRNSSLNDSDETESTDRGPEQETLPIENQMMRDERVQCFFDYLKKLPPNFRMVLVLSDVEGMKNTEIAEILGLSLDAVKIRLHRGRTILFQELRADCKADDWL